MSITLIFCCYSQDFFNLMSSQVVASATIICQKICFMGVSCLKVRENGLFLKDHLLYRILATVGSICALKQSINRDSQPGKQLQEECDIAYFRSDKIFLAKTKRNVHLINISVLITGFLYPNEQVSSGECNYCLTRKMQKRKERLEFVVVIALNPNISQIFCHHSSRENKTLIPGQ